MVSRTRVAAVQTNKNVPVRTARTAVTYRQVGACRATLTTTRSFRSVYGHSVQRGRPLTFSVPRACKTLKPCIVDDNAPPDRIYSSTSRRTTTVARTAPQFRNGISGRFVRRKPNKNAPFRSPEISPSLRRQPTAFHPSPPPPRYNNTTCSGTHFSRRVSYEYRAYRRIVSPGRRLTVVQRTYSIAA